MVSKIPTAKELLEESKKEKRDIEKHALKLRYTEKYGDKLIGEILSNEKKDIKRLGQGLHNNKFYYGTSVVYNGSPFSSVVASFGDKRKIYVGIPEILWECKSCGEKIRLFNSLSVHPPKKCSCGAKNFSFLGKTNQIKRDFELNYRTEFNDETLDYVWEIKDIEEALSKEYEVDLKSIFKEILKINKKYIDHLKPEYHEYIACWIIGTYCYSLFEQFGRLYFNAEKGSGKTKQCRIIKYLSFNPMWVTKGTESSIFRDAEATCGTFIIDNMDKLPEDLKRAIEHYIETGWMHDATYRLTNNEKTKTERFLSYCPMALNNICGLDENTIDKTFQIQMLKSINKDIKRTKPTSRNEDWVRIRQKTRLWVLENYEKIIETYESITSELTGREFDVSEGTLTIAKLLGDNQFKRIEALVEEKIAEELIDLENNNMFMIFSKIWKKFLDNPLQQKENVFLSELSDELFEIFNPQLEVGSKEYISRKKGISKYIGKIIRSVPMFRKGGLSNGRTYIEIQRKDLKQYMVLQHFINEDETLLTSTTSTNSTKSLTSTSIDKNKEKDPKKVDVVEQVDVVGEKIGVGKSSKIKKFIALENFKQPINDNGDCVKLEKNKQYSTSILGDMAQEMLKILIQDNRAQLVEAEGK